MSEDWVQWQGHTINGEFQLGEYLGGSDHSAVFLTELSDPEPRKVAIKFIFAHSPGAELRFSRWKLAAKLSHPRLIRIFRTGRCELGNSDLLYAVMEFAEEAVSQVLPYRALTPAEVRDLLAPALEALSYLHGQGFVHAHIEPANILAVGDQVKLSSDDLVPLAQSDRAGKAPSPYDPPEYAEGRVSAAGDIWSLGMTLVEILTRRLPVWEPASTSSKATKQGHAVLPETLPPPFLEMARNCLRPEAEQRWKIRDIVACLNPASGKKAAPVSPPAAPPKPAPAATEGKQTPAESRPAPATRLIAASPPRKLAAGKRTGFAKSWPAIAAAAALIAVLMVVPRLFKHGSEAQTLAAPSAVPGEPTPAVSNVPRKAEERSRRRSPNSPELVPSPASLHSDAIRNTSAGTWQPGEVLEDVVPDVPQKARDTIHGKVRVSIKVHVDELGNVAGVDFAVPGPSKYFANLALGAARRWQFSPAKASGQNVPSDWILRFEFSRTDTQVFPKPAA